MEIPGTPGLAPGRWRGLGVLPGVIAAVVLTSMAATAAETNTVAFAGTEPLTGVGSSVIRVLSALGITLGLFFAGIWLFRNWQRLVARPGRAPALQILECRALGGRQSLWVVSYQGQRMLLGSSSAGISLLAHLPASEELRSPEPVPAALDFASAFQQILGRKP